MNRNIERSEREEPNCHNPHDQCFWCLAYLFLVLGFLFCFVEKFCYLDFERKKSQIFLKHLTVWNKVFGLIVLCASIAIEFFWCCFVGHKYDLLYIEYFSLLQYLLICGGVVFVNVWLICFGYCDFTSQLELKNIFPLDSDQSTTPCTFSGLYDCSFTLWPILAFTKCTKLICHWFIWSV